ncbi:MAG: cobalamin-binding protein [Thermogemmatispora sp.]|jgi:iron complex transport system substrate-binding protein|uniref:Cobalamin-binding protein n=1 Tax=Thermogemmatispora aurantia TaxID=2045279 RepID=A0A5J4K8F2_9CHLR|nr:MULTISPECIES: cobalamin-binding protein [Thermogemmatispora]MBE3565711.1 cobalamin-binding protein [Thermogemmatispora sp.]GER82970.1 cobalamin-binding protein [Thermogemmatispora aurantia]
MRIVSLLASATEMVAALGCTEQLVGRSHECDYPPEVQHLPALSRPVIDINTNSAGIDAQVRQLAGTRRTGDEAALQALSIYQIDVALLQELQPDVILTQTQCEVCAVSERDVSEAVRQLTGLQPRIVSLAPYRLSDVWEDLRRVGAALGRLAEAEALIASYQQRLEELRQRCARLSAERGQAPRVAVLEWLDPLMGAGNWTPELITYAGGEPVLSASGQHAPWISWDELRQANPEVLILSPCGFDVERTRQDAALLEQHSAWSELRAVREGRVYLIDGNHYLNRSGPRLVESAELIARALWGEHAGIPLPAEGWQPLR